MKHHSSETTLSPNEREFADVMQHGDDFLKIELLRPAKAWYTKALKYNMETEKVKQKIADCDAQLAFERKIIWLLVCITTISVFLFFIL